MHAALKNYSNNLIMTIKFRFSILVNISLYICIYNFLYKSKTNIFFPYNRAHYENSRIDIKTFKIFQ